MFSLGATGELLCLDAASGERRWRRDVLLDTDAEALKYGFGATPLVHGELVLVTGADPRAGGCGVIAYQRSDGEPVWRALDERMTYSSPRRARAGRARAAGGVHRHARRGPGPERRRAAVGVSLGGAGTALSCTQPVRIDDQHVLVAAGYGAGATLIRLEASEGTFRAEPAWRNSRLKSR